MKIYYLEFSVYFLAVISVEVIVVSWQVICFSWTRSVFRTRSCCYVHCVFAEQTLLQPL